MKLIDFTLRCIIVTALVAALLYIFLPRYIPFGPNNSWLQDRYTGLVDTASNHLKEPLWKQSPPVQESPEP